MTNNLEDPATYVYANCEQISKLQEWRKMAKYELQKADNYATRSPPLTHVDSEQGSRCIATIDLGIELWW